MNPSERDTLRELMRRVDEVRGLAEGRERAPLPEAPSPAALLETLDELVQELERSHRRLIETNVQLVSLREVASSMVATFNGEDTTRTVTRYLCRAFGFDDGFLLLVNRDARRLEGTWTHFREGRERSYAISVPLLGDHGAVTRALWMNRTVVHHTAAGAVTVALPEGHPLQDVLDELAAAACVPLQSSHPVIAGETSELCGARCMLGDAALVAPPPGPHAASWAFEREERQQQCLGCELMPALGVIGLGRRRGSAPLIPSDVTQLESIALSVAPVVENARLTQDLRRSEQFRQHVLDSMSSALVAVDLTGNILTFNRAAEELLAFREADVVGQAFGALLGSDGEAVLKEAIEHGREAVRIETVLRAQDGSPLPVLMSTSLLRNERRSVYGAIASFVDLTPIKKAEEHAQRLDRLAALGRFTSSVAHEIRNPLTGIGAGIQYLSRAMEGDARHRENLDFILREIKRLDRIVQDLFDVTHPRSLSLRAQPMDETVRRAAQCLEALVAERRVTLQVDVAERTPPVPHDADQIQQVVINLIKNAVEASPPDAAVRVRVRPGERGGARRRGAPAGAQIRVEDAGPGISPEHQRTLFEPFFTTKPGGSGLGLYISHDIVKRHGGSLTVSSEPGRGSTFTVELPLENHGGHS